MGNQNSKAFPVQRTEILDQKVISEKVFLVFVHGCIPELSIYVLLFLNMLGPLGAVMRDSGTSLAPGSGQTVGPTKR